MRHVRQVCSTPNGLVDAVKQLDVSKLKPYTSSKQESDAAANRCGMVLSVALPACQHACLPPVHQAEESCCCPLSCFLCPVAGLLRRLTRWWALRSIDEKLFLLHKVDVRSHYGAVGSATLLHLPSRGSLVPPMHPSMGCQAQA